MSGPRIVVIGSANMDLVVQAERIPAPGETILGGAFSTLPGGKGANQAVASARLGGDVVFVGRVGADAFGDGLRQEMTNAGIPATFLTPDPDAPSGVALIGVDANGQNAIMVAPGANGKVRREDVDRARDAIVESAFVVVQLEIPLDTVQYAVQSARALGTPVLLNPAPVGIGGLPDTLLAQVDVLTPNEHEAAQLLGYAAPDGLDFVQVAQQLRARGVKTVVITLGSAGCLLADAEGSRMISAPQVQAVDTTAAGDCFSGALAVALGEGKTLDEAARFAVQAASLSVTRLGAQPSLPTREEVETELTISE